MTRKMQPARWICLVVSILAVYLAAESRASTRVRRYLGFPKGASLTVTIAMSTFLPKDVVPKNIANGFGHIMEYDLAYVFPDHLAINRPPPIKPKKKKKDPVSVNSQPWDPEYYLEFPDKRKWKTKRRGKLLDQLSNVMDSNGYAGKACLERLSCEAHEHLLWGRSLLEDLILALVPAPSPAAAQRCQLQTFQDCSVSLLQIFLHSEQVEQVD